MKRYDYPWTYYIKDNILDNDEIKFCNYVFSKIEESHMTDPGHMLFNYRDWPQLKITMYPDEVIKIAGIDYQSTVEKTAVIYRTWPHKKMKLSEEQSTIVKNLFSKTLDLCHITNPTFDRSRAISYLSFSKHPEIFRYKVHADNSYKFYSVVIYFKGTGQTEGTRLYVPGGKEFEYTTVPWVENRAMLFSPALDKNSDKFLHDYGNDRGKRWTVMINYEYE